MVKTKLVTNIKAPTIKWVVVVKTIISLGQRSMTLNLLKYDAVPRISWSANSTVNK
jgi:hypothetical protein